MKNKFGLNKANKIKPKRFRLGVVAGQQRRASRPIEEEELVKSLAFVVPEQDKKEQTKQLG